MTPLELFLLKEYPFTLGLEIILFSIKIVSRYFLVITRKQLVPQK